MRLVLAVSLAAVVITSCVTSGSRSPNVVTVGDSQDGRSVAAHTGDTVRVVLDSTAWTISGSSDAGVLQPGGEQVVSPGPPGSCFPGMNCGTTTDEFRALKPGIAMVTATRVSCGEARVCVGAEGIYRVTVVVS